MIKKLTLANFRNYSSAEISLDSDINVFVGNNGQGKTNILEAVFFISMLRSFRTSRINDLKKIGSPGFYICSEINTSGAGWNTKLEIDYGNVRRLRIDSVNISKASDFIRKIKTVVFSPDDINIISGSSVLRRRFADILISMEEPSYLNALTEYLIALKSRNTSLKMSKPDISMIKAYEAIISEKACSILQFRQKYTEMLSNEVKSILKDYFSRDVEFIMKYRNSSGSSAVGEYMEKFEKEREKDIARKVTGFGPQMDDFEFIMDSKLLRNYGSTGQCRLISLCLKMAEVNILSGGNERKTDNLIVLVDDVTGDLDPKTRESFYHVISKASQTLFTFTELPSEEHFKNVSVFQISNGNILI